MTKYELNKAIAELCGFPCVSTRAEAATFPCVLDFGEGCLTLLEKEIEPDCDPWDPANNWQQVHKFVIPAANGHGLDVKCDMLSHWANATSVWRGDEILRSTSEGNDESHCRVTCIAIYDVWEKLEARR